MYHKQTTFTKYADTAINIILWIHEAVMPLPDSTSAVLP